MLLEQLESVLFSPENGDVLVSVGDIIDGGFENDDMIRLLDEPWFNVAYGNHEQLMKRATKSITEEDFDRVSSFLIDQGGLQMVYDLNNDIATVDSIKKVAESLTKKELHWVANGGAWFYDVFYAKGFAYRRAQAAKLFQAELPLAIEVNHPKGRVGVVHAGLKGNNWNNIEFIARYRPNQLLWMRDHIMAFENDEKPAVKLGLVQGVDALVVGHSVPKRGLPLILANTMYIDVGAKQGKPPFVIEITDVLNAVMK